MAASCYSIQHATGGGGTPRLIEPLAEWEGVLAIVGWRAGHRAVLEDGKWVNKGRIVPDQLPRA